MKRYHLPLFVAALALVGACRSGSRSATPAETANAPAGEARPAEAPSDGGRLVPAAELSRRVPDLDLDAWYGMYLGEAKIGYGRMTLRPTEGDEPGAYLSRLVLTMVDAGSAERVESTMQTDYYYAGEPPYPLIARHELERERDARVEKRWQFGPDGGTLRVTLDGKEQPVREVPATAETLAATVEPILADPGTLSVGTRVRYPTFDTDRNRDTETELEVVSIDRVLLSGVETRVATYRMSEEHGAVFDMKVAEGGVTVSVGLGGLQIELEAEEVARSDVRGFETFNDGVPVNRALGDPDELRELTLLVGAPDGATLPSAANQQVKRRPDGRFEVRLRMGPGAATDPDAEAAALEDSSDVDHRAPAIRALARELTEGIESRADRVEALRRWVFENLTKDLQTNIGTASQVLAHRRGDCTEHALLLAALARALDIPARRVAGLIYMGDEFQRFGWHEWNEVAIDGRWVPIDASWSPPIASAARLKLGDETSDAHMALIGRLTLEVRRGSRSTQTTHRNRSASGQK